MDTIGPIIFDLESTQITSQEREILQHPLIGGVIFFSRNFETPEQIATLAQELRAIKGTPLLLCVDQEGGRVQRFRQGFQKLPSAANIGMVYDDDAALGLRYAKICGWVMAAEVLSVNIDLSFAPVLDLDKGLSLVIKDRSFHRDVATAVELAFAFIQGMRSAGMSAVGKHFPGHGSVLEDSHLELPEDNRSLSEIANEDMQVFSRLIPHLQGIMPAHILFKQLSDQPVGFSTFWLQKILRHDLNFSGIIFSDDLSMQGAKHMGDFPARAKLALDAGCDMLLMCNNRKGVLQTLAKLKAKPSVSLQKFATLQADFNLLNSQLKNTSQWQQNVALMEKISLQYHPAVEN